MIGPVMRQITFSILSWGMRQSWLGCMTSFLKDFSTCPNIDKNKKNRNKPGEGTEDFALDLGQVELLVDVLGPLATGCSSSDKEELATVGCKQTKSS